MKFAHLFHVLSVASLSVLAAAQNSADVRHLTLREAVHLAVSQNRGLKIARLKILENEHKKAGERSLYFPLITNQSNLLHVTDLQNVAIPAGAFGTAGGGIVPAHSIYLEQGQNHFVSSGTQISQPLTQLIRIHAANRIAASEVRASRDEVKKAATQVALQVHTLYYSILIAGLQKQAAEQQTAYAEANLRQSEEDVRKGSMLRVATLQGRAGLLESQQSVLTADLQLSDLTTELNDLLVLPLNTKLELDPAVPSSFEQGTREEYIQAAWSENPEISAAEEAIQKAQAGVGAAKAAYIPDVTAFARHSYQNGVPFLVRNFGTLDLNMNWDVFDFGKRRAAVREREAQLSQAEENLERVKEEVVVRVERSYNKLDRTRHLVEVTNQIVKLRQEVNDWRRTTSTREFCWCPNGARLRPQLTRLRRIISRRVWVICWHGGTRAGGRADTRILKPAARGLLPAPSESFGLWGSESPGSLGGNLPSRARLALPTRPSGYRETLRYGDGCLRTFPLIEWV